MKRFKFIFYIFELVVLMTLCVLAMVGSKSWTEAMAYGLFFAYFCIAFYDDLRKGENE